MPTSVEELRASLEGHNAEFEALLRLIPAKYYLVPEDSGEYASKYQKNVKKQKAPKQAIKEASKKAKRDRLDPANNKSIVELQEEKAALKKKGKAREVSSGSGDDDAEGPGVEDLELDMDQMDVDDNGNEDDSEGHAENANEAAVELKPMQAPASIETLRAKLRARMEELRRKNGRGRKDSVPSGPADSAGPGSKDELLEERRQHRAALREKRRKETKEKKRREREEREREEEERKKKKGKEKEKQQTAAGQTAKPQLLVPDIHGREGQGASSQSSNVNVTFSTLSGTTPNMPKSLKTSSNPSVALSQLQNRLQSRSSLPSASRQQLEERETWAKAAARVQGAKVHDDPSRLKKAAKRKEKEKVKSKKEWEKRKEEVEKSMAARQKKRADNIAMRHEKRKGGKGGKGGSKKDAKSMKRRPGFEGKGFGGGGAKKAGASGKAKGGK